MVAKKGESDAKELSRQAVLREMWQGKDDHKIDNLLNQSDLLHLACSPEMEAMTKQSDTLVKQLLQAGADPNAVSESGSFPLMLTSSAEIAGCLLDNGADIEQQSNDGSTALRSASSAGRLPVVKVLLQRGAQHQILMRSDSCETPVSTAVRNGHQAVALVLLNELLLLPGFDINHPRLAATQPLLCAAAAVGMLRVVETALDNGAFVNACGPAGTALMLAARNGHLETVNLLCERGADVRMRRGDVNLRVDSLFKAVAGGHVQVAKALIKHGSDVNDAADAQQKPLLVVAAMRGNCETLTLLLKAGATLDQQQQFQCLSLATHILSDAAAVKVTKALLPHCSSLEYVDDNGHTALTYAVAVGKLQTARALYAAGANVQHTDSDGTVLHCAAESGFVATVKWLQSLSLDARAVSSEQQLLPLHVACLYGHYDLVKHLIDVPGAAGDVHARTVEGLTPLHLAASAPRQPLSSAASPQQALQQTAVSTGAERVVQLLLQRGAAADARADACPADGGTTVSGVTPLMLASTAPVIKLLLAAGADATAADSAGMHVLHHSAKHGAAAGAVCLLLKARADPTATDTNGSTAAHVAGMSGHFALEALLSRAAEDYRKAHAHVHSCSSSSGGACSTSCCSDSSARTTGDTTTSSATQQQQQQQQQQQPLKRKAKHPCANCKKLTRKLCRGCAAVYYCSVDCQKVCFRDAKHRAQCTAKAQCI
jgi:ankyrin repeat protein